MGSYEPLFLEMKPNLIPHLQLVWNPMLVMSLLVLSIEIFQNFMDLLVDVLDLFKKIHFPYQPQPKHGKIPPVWMQGAELHQLGPMVGTLGTPKKGCGW